MDKRTFLKNFSLLSLSMTPFMKVLASTVNDVKHIHPRLLAHDEDFWASIRSNYLLTEDYINLENGYYCMMPQDTLNEYIKHVEAINFHASHYMRTVQGENNKIMRIKLAEMAGCTVDELIITRNTTESLDIVIGGMHWQEGDEAVMADQDYGAMLNMFRLMGERYGVVSKKISLPNHPKSDEEIVEMYAEQITSKTKLLMVCHVVNINGHVLPIRKICDMAHSKGVEVVVDGAHAFAHIDFKLEDLNCDYYGTSLHKWLSAPMGAGFLYVKKDKIKNLWPLFAEDIKDEDDIERLNHTGTKPVHIDLAIANAIDYHTIIGSERKQERLRFLKNYWTSRVKDNPNIILNTPHELERSSAIANVLVKGMESREMAKTLMDKYRIWTVAIDRPNVHGCRITPNVFTTTEELDLFVAALIEMAGS
jgi:selenocysteine lyase/cysteine desulfurase